MAPSPSKRELARRSLEKSQAKRLKAFGRQLQRERENLDSAPILSVRSLTRNPLSYAQKYKAIKDKVNFKLKSPNRAGTKTKTKITRLFNIISKNHAMGKTFVRTNSAKKSKILNTISDSLGAPELKGGFLNFTSIGTKGRVKWKRGGNFEIQNRNVFKKTTRNELYVPVNAKRAYSDPTGYFQKLLARYPERANYIPIQKNGEHDFYGKTKTEFILRLSKWFYEYDRHGAHDMTKWYRGVQLVFTHFKSRRAARK